jgi:uncharacterized protein YjbI with pentapeptide repeats
MPNHNHCKILKQGVEAWNRWRRDNLGIRPDLIAADLRRADLRRANLWRADIAHADLEGAKVTDANLKEAVLNNAKFTHGDLSRSDLCRATLDEADLTSANLSYARLEEATLRRVRARLANLEHSNLLNAFFEFADFSGVNFDSANLQGADFRQTNLVSANFRNAHLWGANFTDAHLDDSVFSEASIGGTIFGRNDLSGVQGLEFIEHRGPSIIGIETLALSRGQIPEVFLRGCGLSNWEIESAKLHQSSLGNEEITDITYRIHDLRAHQAIQINPLFISYSHLDSPFVEKIDWYLKERGVRFWRDIHHATAGRLETQIDRAIRLNPTVLLILSAHSVASDWVQHEARLARKLEIETKRDVLCPVALDESWKACKWPERLREQIMEYHILDFSEWIDEHHFDRMFGRLLDGLDLFYQ